MSPPGLRILFLSFLRIGLSSFGGGTSAWLRREVVERRGWMSDEEFLASLTVAQVLPGANPVNMSVYIGLQLRGVGGAAAAAAGMLLPCFAVILALAVLYDRFGDLAVVRTVLAGLAAVGVGAVLAFGISSSRRLKGDVVLTAVAVGIFLAVGVLDWPLVPCALAAAAVGIGVSYRKDGAA